MKISAQIPKSFLFILSFCLFFPFLPLSGKVLKEGKKGNFSLPTEKTPLKNPSQTVDGKEKKKEIKKGSIKTTIPVSEGQKRFFRDLAIILELMRKSSPETAEKLEQRLKTDPSGVMKDFLSGMKCGIFCVTVSPGENKKSIRKKPLQEEKKFFAERLYKEKILYFRLPDLSPEVVGKVFREMKNFVRNGKIVLDLRDCQDYRKDTALEKLFQNMTLRASGGKRNAPTTALLIGNMTKGNGEIFAYKAAKLPGVILMGHPTFGQPFLLRRLPMTMVKKSSAAGGKTKVMHILVPQIPEHYKKIPAGKISPRIRTKFSPVYKKNTDILEKDTTLRIACDLLLSMNIMGNKQSEAI